MVLPTPLLLEVRWAFKNCARLRSTHVRPVRGFQSGPSFFKKTGPQSDPRTKQKDGLGATRVASSGPARSHTVGETPPTTSNGTPQQSKDLIPTARDATSVGGRRSSDVPIKVIPKAQVSPQLTLSPVERLQIEYITRQPPKHLGPKKIFREKLLIYHGGVARMNAITFIKVTSAVIMFAFLGVVVPAHWTYGSPWYTVCGLACIGAVPFVLVNFLSRPFVNWIHLSLPHFARQSPKAALEYSRNLPENCLLQITFMRSTGLPAMVEANVTDLRPAFSWWRPMTFEWFGSRVAKGSLLRPNPTFFYVRPLSGTGKEARDTIPGIWENVYKRIVGIETGAVSKWRK